MRSMETHLDLSPRTTLPCKVVGEGGGGVWTAKPSKPEPGEEGEPGEHEPPAGPNPENEESSEEEKPEETKEGRYKLLTTWSSRPGERPPLKPEDEGRGTRTKGARS